MSRDGLPVPSMPRSGVWLRHKNDKGVKKAGKYWHHLWPPPLATTFSFGISGSALLLLQRVPSLR